MSSPGQNITSVLKETRVFPPPKAFADAAHIKSPEEADRLRKWAADDPDGFWAEQAKSLDWFKPWSPRCSTGRTRRTPSGSSAGSSTPATTASTGT